MILTRSSIKEGATSFIISFSFSIIVIDSFSVVSAYIEIDGKAKEICNGAQWKVKLNSKNLKITKFQNYAACSITVIIRCNDSMIFYGYLRYLPDNNTKLKNVEKCGKIL